MKLIIEDLGRDKWKGSISIPDNSDADDIAYLARKKASKHLISRFPDTDYDATTNKGTVSTGFRTVGKFHIEKDNGKGGGS